VTLCMHGHLNRENREVLLVSILMPASCARVSVGRSENVSDGKSDMNANRNSDESVVPSWERKGDCAKKLGKGRWCQCELNSETFGSDPAGVNPVW
jgi:hypothetical protein